MPRSAGRRGLGVVDRPDLLVADRDAVLVDAVLGAPEPGRAREQRSARAPASGSSRYCVRTVPPAAPRGYGSRRPAPRRGGRSEFFPNSVPVVTDDAQRVAHRYADASSAARCRGLSGSPVTCSTSASQRTASPGAKSSVDQEPARGRAVDEAAGARPQRRLQLRRDELPVQVVLVVDGREREVELRGPVGCVPPFRAAQQLVPARRAPTSGRRDRRPGRRRGRARSWSSRAPSGRTSGARRDERSARRGCELGQVRVAHAGDGAEPLRIAAPADRRASRRPRS